MKDYISVMLVLICLFPLVYCQCHNNSQPSLPSNYTPYLSSSPLTASQLSLLPSLYSLLSSIDSYSINLTPSLSFHPNNYAHCTSTTPSSYTSSSDIWFCFDSLYLLQCNPQWSLLIKCGTYIEFHLPFNPKILA